MYYFLVKYFINKYGSPIITTWKPLTAQGLSSECDTFAFYCHFQKIHVYLRPDFHGYSHIALYQSSVPPLAAISSVDLTGHILNFLSKYLSLRLRGSSYCIFKAANISRDGETPGMGS
ncbi:hypothetical protein FKM82_018123 [Ascaphus truei]